MIAGVVVLSGCGPSTPKPGEPLAVTETIGELGDSPGRFAYPRAMDLAGGSGQGTAALWVIDKTARVQLIDVASGRCEALWRMPDSELGKPTGITVGPGRTAAGAWRDDLIYIPDTHYHRVIVYSVERGGLGERSSAATTAELVPTEVGRFGGYGMEAGQFIYPTDVAVLASEDGTRVERIYVSEYGGNDRVSVYDGEHRPLFAFGRFGTGASGSDVQFNRPQSMAIVRVGGGRELIVTDARNHRVGRFTLDGDLIGWLGQVGDRADPTAKGADAVPPGRFNFPWGLADLGDGTVLVSEFGAGRVQRIDLASGKSLGTWGRAGRGEGELATPWAVAVEGGRAFALDSGNNRILGFALGFRAAERRLTRVEGGQR